MPVSKQADVEQPAQKTCRNYVIDPALQLLPEYISTLMPLLLSCPLDGKDYDNHYSVNLLQHELTPSNKIQIHWQC